MDIRYSYKAGRQLSALPSLIQHRIAEKMLFFATQENPLVFSRFIKLDNIHRFRIGDYRIFFIVINKIIWVLKIERRDKAYD